MSIVRILSIYILAGLAEIGGGYLVWHWLRSGKPVFWGIAGAIILVMYGIIATFQPAGFSKVYSTYGGVFVLISVAWGYSVDGTIPSMRDWLGLTLIVGSVLLMITEKPPNPEVW